jgi:transposase
MKQRRQYTKEFTQGAVRLVTQQGRSITEAASSLSISAWNLARWVQAAKKQGQQAFPGNGNRTPQEQEIFDLRQRIKQLEEEKEILKKAAAYFATHLS